ncbi:MAG: hypothetical protein ABI572_05510 [Actinomycetota bacterium]
MDQLPPPPGRPDDPFPGAPGLQVPAAMAGQQRRPGPVSGAGWALVVIGALTVLAGLFLSSIGIDSSTVVVAMILVLTIGAGNILAGVLVLRLRPLGRTLGFVFAGLGFVGGLAQLSGRPGSAIITLMADGFILWALATNREAFLPQR